MFEDSLVESQVAAVSAVKRWTMLGSTALQAAIAATLITLPLLHPERLAFHVETPLVFTPPPPRPPIHVEAQQMASSSTDAVSIPVMQRPMISLISHPTASPNDAPPFVGKIDFGPGAGDAIGAVMSSSATGPVAVSVAKPTTPKRVAVSSGVSAGLLLSPIRPVYPAIAKAAGISGTVVVEAVISRSGTVESLNVVSGPQMLRAAALDAIRTARYKPYMLNGDPTEVQTTFTVNFRIGG